jgi:hypothetical protein
MGFQAAGESVNGIGKGLYTLIGKYKYNNMNTEKKIIRFDSPEAAQKKTVDVWVSSTGRMFVNEDAARYDGCTHCICECSELAEKGYSMCPSCRTRKAKERYNAKPFKEWDGTTPLVSDRFDKYFFSDADIIDFVEEMEEDNEGFDPETGYADLDLIICEPNYLRQLDFDGDEFPEDQTEEDMCSKEVLAKLKELNEIIKAHPPISWSAGKYRTAYAKI